MPSMEPRSLMLEISQNVGNGSGNSGLFGIEGIVELFDDFTELFACHGEICGFPVAIVGDAFLRELDAVFGDVGLKEASLSIDGAAEDRTAQTGIHLDGVHRLVVGTQMFGEGGGACGNVAALPPNFELFNHDPDGASVGELGLHADAVGFC